MCHPYCPILFRFREARDFRVGVVTDMYHLSVAGRRAKCHFDTHTYARTYVRVGKISKRIRDSSCTRAPSDVPFSFLCQMFNESDMRVSNSCIALVEREQISVPIARSRRAYLMKRKKITLYTYRSRYS